ncbi:FAST kinase domain-containing protein 4 isoform X1 [Pieris rapae]|uniref:FAST kinase domain-containing protein 4 isoform X1 n=2 Tax=Pieris rapae TaxID=64459 RepID=UPI001E27AD0F|nr:FAST kinase domain-containing protein 4 isoform X1 [Pieris rapae]
MIFSLISQYLTFMSMLKFGALVSWRLGSRSAIRNLSGPGATVIKSDKSDHIKDVNGKVDEFELSDEKARTGLVAAAFATLNAPESELKKPSVKSVKLSRTQQLDTLIIKATDINSLLSVAENPIVSRKHALKMVSVLSEWSSSNRVKLSDFEKDPRFLKLCRILARTPASHAMTSLTMAEDLSTVLGITGDDEAARLIGNLSLSQMIKVMKALQQKSRRSTPLLRALSYNITKQPDNIDLKKSADLLFSMASLNFPDPVLLDRICSEVIKNLPSNTEKSAVVHSILVSLGLLKYRHEEALTALVGWMQTNRAVCRPSDVASAVVTLANVNFVPPKAESFLEAALLLKEDEMTKALSWLDLVFSLLVLEKAEMHHLASTLKPEFIDKLLSLGEISIPSRRKLMAIDAYVAAKDPNSARLPEDISVGVAIVHTKEKALFVQSVMDTFKSLVSADTFLQRDCNSGMGFLYDAEFAVDSKCHPVPLQKAVNNSDVHRIAVLALDYHDMTRRVPVEMGTFRLYTRLLELRGFKVLKVPYTEYNPKDKLVSRVQYLEKRLKELIAL